MRRSDAFAIFLREKHGHAIGDTHYADAAGGVCE
jgi:hypothetical protein